MQRSIVRAILGITVLLMGLAPSFATAERVNAGMPGYVVERCVALYRCLLAQDRGVMASAAPRIGADE